MEENGEDIVSLCCGGTMKSVPVIASLGKKKARKLSAGPVGGFPFHLPVSADILWPF